MRVHRASEEDIPGRIPADGSPRRVLTENVVASVELVAARTGGPLVCLPGSENRTHVHPEPAADSEKFLKIELAVTGFEGLHVRRREARSVSEVSDTEALLKS